MPFKYIYSIFDMVNRLPPVINSIFFAVYFIRFLNSHSMGFTYTQGMSTKITKKRQTQTKKNYSSSWPVVLSIPQNECRSCFHSRLRQFIILLFLHFHVILIWNSIIANYTFYSQTILFDSFALKSNKQSRK